VKRFDRFLGRVWLLGVPFGILVAVVVIVIARSSHGSAAGGADEVMVDRAVLRPGQIVLVLVNDSGESARVAQAIVSDAYVDFRASRAMLRPDDVARITLLYPWIRGESYDVELLMSPEGAVEYEIEEAEPGSQTAESA
jgi:ZIP family zinc transporter